MFKIRNINVFRMYFRYIRCIFFYTLNSIDDQLCQNWLVWFCLIVMRSRPMMSLKSIAFYPMLFLRPNSRSKICSKNAVIISLSLCMCVSLSHTDERETSEMWIVSVRGNPACNPAQLITLRPELRNTRHTGSNCQIHTHPDWFIMPRVVLTHLSKMWDLKCDRKVHSHLMHIAQNWKALSWSIKCN